jgi:hypothetical protein
MLEEGARDRVNHHFNGKRVFTIYRNHKRVFKEFPFMGLTILGADTTMAYGNVSVEVHFLVRHKITLRNPKLPCVIFITKGVNHLYPIELLDLVPHQDYYKSTEMNGYATLKSRHFRLKRHYRNYMDLVINHRVPKLLNWYKMEKGWTFEKCKKLAPEKLASPCKTSMSSIEKLCDQMSCMSILAKPYDKYKTMGDELAEGTTGADEWGITDDENMGKCLNTFIYILYIFVYIFYILDWIGDNILDSPPPIRIREVMVDEHKCKIPGCVADIPVKINLNYTPSIQGESTSYDYNGSPVPLQ